LADDWQHSRSDQQCWTDTGEVLYLTCDPH